nr:ribonuclease H-like domain-containing protein [Tanacetum cinerariifolium]
MVPDAVLTQSKPVSITAVRPVSAVVPKIKVTRPRHANLIITKSNLPIRRHLTRSPSLKASNSPPRVTAVKAPVGNPQYALKDKGVIDSGCSRHMTGNMSYLSDFGELNGGYVTFGGNPKGGKISGKGKIRTGKLDFDDVYFVKELKFNLFSVSQMCDKKNSVLFTYTECLVLSPDFKLPDEKQVLLRVPKENNMYNVNLKNIVPSGDLTCLFTKATIDESNLLHRRLGHINFKTINKLVKGNLVKGLPTKVFENDNTCVVCKKGKQHRASCKTKPVSSVDQPLYRLHIDLFGPTFVKSLNKKSYCLVVTDDYSRFTWVFFLATKDETSLILKTFITGLEIQLSLKVKVISSDNGTEFKNNDLNHFRGIKRIKREFSKFDGTVDEGFLVRYSVSSKSFRVFNSRTRIVQETLHMNFLKNKPNVASSGPIWLFDIDSLTRTTNYYLVTTGNQTNPSAGFQDKFGAEKAGEEIDQQYVLFPVWSSGSTNPQNNDGDAAFDGKKPDFDAKKPESEVIFFPSSSAQLRKQDDKTKKEDKGKKLEDITYFDDEDDVGVEADFNNLETSITVSPIPTIRVHKDHPVSQIIGGLSSTTQTRSMTIVVKDQGGLSQMFNDDFHTCMFACFLSHEEPKRKVWIFVDLSYGKRAIGSKWVFKNKKDERGIVIRNKARLVTQGHTQEDEIDYEEVFAPVARIEAIRLFLAYASFMGFMVYQMDVKRAILYETIKEEVYVCQPLGFEDPDHPDKVYKVVKELYGLHQAPRAWYETLANYLLENGFQRGKIDQTLFIKRQKVKRIFRYLKGKPYLGLWYPKDSPFDLVAYSDSDYAGASLDRKSTTRGCQFLRCKLISWQCKKQRVVATSSIEAEYVAAASCCCSKWNGVFEKDVTCYNYLKCWLPHHTTNGSQFTMYNPHKNWLVQIKRPLSWLVQKQTAFGKDKSNPLTVHSLLKTIWSSIHHLLINEVLTIPRQTTTVFLLPKVEKVGIGVNAVDLQVSAVRHMLLLLVQKLLLFSLTTWCCSLSAVSEGFHQIIDFLNGISIKYALIMNPNIYVSCIKQFWTTVAVKQVNDVTRLQALVDKKKVVVTEATIREALCLDDAEGVDCLPNEEIFAELARMGYEKPSTKRTFYKAFFSSQWKFLIHTILQCMSAKRTSWNEFSSSMASAVICLSSGRKFNFSKYIFDSLVRNIDSTTKFYMYPRFLQLIIRKQVGKGFSRVETPLFEGMLVDQQVDEEGDADANVEEVNAGDVTKGDVSATHGEVPTVAEEQSISYPTPPTPPPQPPQDILSTSQALEITKLKRRVKKLERRNTMRKLKFKRLQRLGTPRRVETSNETVLDDVSNQEKMIAEMDQDDEVEELKRHLQIVPNKDDDVYTEATPLARKVPVVDYQIIEMNNKPYYKIIRADGIHQLYDKQYARELHAELNKNIDWDEVIDHVKIKAKEDPAVKKYQAMKRKPQTEGQARKNMMLYFKNVAGFKMDYFKGMSYDDIRLIFEDKFNSNQTGDLHFRPYSASNGAALILTW